MFADYTHQPKGMITAIDGETGRILWKYQTDAQMLAGLVPTKSGLVFAGDVRGNLFVFDAKTGAVLEHLDLGSALNNGLISYAVDGTQYVAAALGGVTLNTRGVSGPLAVKVFGLRAAAAPKIVKFDRLETQTTGAAANAELFMRVCAPCHGIRNDAATGIPGRIGWHEAPAGMSTETSPGVPKSGPQLCRDLKDKSKNGNRDLAQLLDFVHTDPFIPWAWDPGTRPNGKPRTAPPLATHDQFRGILKKWIDAGAPCPG